LEVFIDFCISGLVFSWIKQFEMSVNDELIKACRKNKHEQIQKLLQNPNVSVNKRNRDGDTPIIFAASSCHKETLHILLSDPRTDLSVVNRFVFLLF